MWTFFAPETKIVAKLFLKQDQILQVSRPPIPRRSPLPSKLDTLVWCWDWNGTEMTKVYYWSKIAQYWGTKAVNQLAYYPLNFLEDAKREELCKLMRERGERYIKIVRGRSGATQMYIYEGLALSERRSVIRTSRDAVWISNCYGDTANQN